MRLKILGQVARLEVPKRKSRQTITLRLTEEGCDAVTIDWRPAHPDWDTGRLQLAVVGGERGLLENEEKFGKLYKEYSKEEVEQLLEEARNLSRSGSPPLALMDGDETASSAAASDKRKPAEWLKEGCRSK